jgi:hypothetical protein
MIPDPRECVAGLMLLRSLDHYLGHADLCLEASTSIITPNFHIDEIVVSVGKKCPCIASVHRMARSDGRTYSRLGVTSEATAVDQSGSDDQCRSRSSRSPGYALDLTAYEKCRARGSRYEAHGTTVLGTN